MEESSRSLEHTRDDKLRHCLAKRDLALPDEHPDVAIYIVSFKGEENGFGDTGGFGWP